uniref:Uncharacterized protein n=1 Tax=Dikerogammarus haemobaphes virus 1 TaxID=2704946 RepID=A0A6G9HEV6_9VIRU|nr:hypothetical protein [Dikerogammarus haemobaphes virus 1]
MAVVPCTSLIYCGTLALDRAKYHRLGTRFECLQKGFGAGVQSTLPSYSLQLIPSWSDEGYEFLLGHGMRAFNERTSRENKFKRVVHFLHLNGNDTEFLVEFIGKSIKNHPIGGNLLAKKYNALITFLRHYASTRERWDVNVGHCMEYD